ncbi:MAG: YicC family protein [Eubacterium sp.]|nr:YicC family protein [Eubacterium sp.]
MIQSMTGFGRAEMTDEEKKITVEMKSVNHRYADFTIKMPRRFNRFEAGIRNVLKEYIRRGKVDVYITFQSFTDSDVTVKYNREIAREYVKYFREMREEFPAEMEDAGQNLSPVLLGRFPEVFSLEESESEDDDSLFDDLTKVLREACEHFTAARNAEGENLKKDLLDKVDTMEALAGQVEELSPVILENYKKKLTEKVREFLDRGDLEEGRIAAEVTIFADKICVDEEMVRLKSHIAQTREILNSDGAVGRKLDFIVQEMNREANTTLSKAGSAEVTDIGIEMKTLIEMIREQIQNLE